MKRVGKISASEIEEDIKTVEEPVFSKEVLEHLKHPTFDIWQWKDDELVVLLEAMFKEFGLISAFNIDTGKLRRFLMCVKYTYNKNPFHNFQHCFCVTQMVLNVLISIQINSFILDVRNSSCDWRPHAAYSN
jgi:hypothetical protein